MSDTARVLLARDELRARTVGWASRGRPHPGQKYKHGWIPILGEPLKLKFDRTQDLEDFKNDRTRPQLTDLDIGVSTFDEDQIKKVAPLIAARWDVTREDLDELRREDTVSKALPESDKDRPLEDIKTEYAASVLRRWASSSGDPVSTAAIAGTLDRLGIPYRLNQDGQDTTDWIRSRPGMDRATRGLGWAIYQHTQDWFREHGITEITVARGIRPGGDPPGMAFSSWTYDYGGIRTGQEGLFLGDDWKNQQALAEAARPVRIATIPVSRVFSVAATGFGTSHEHEVVVLPLVEADGEASRSARVLLARAWLRVEDIRLGITRAAGKKDAHGHLHAPAGLGILSGRFVSAGESLQAILDQAAEHDNPRTALSKLRLDHLKELSAHAGLPKTGRKADLVERLTMHVEAPKAPAAKAPVKAAPRKTTAKVARPPATPVDIHSLFDADDATIEAAMRDVYEGKFGPYTTRVSVQITRAGTRTDRRGKEHKVEPSIGIDGRVYDENGHEIGFFSRSIGPIEFQYVDGSNRREVWAQHEVVQLGDGDYGDYGGANPAKYHGKGFGGEFNRRAIEWYRASGVHGISQNDHNFYVWASQGFNFSRGVMPDYKQDELRELIASLRERVAKNKYGEPIPAQLRNAPDLDAQIAEAEALLARLASTKPGEPGYPTAYEVSQLGRNGRRGKTKTWLGKFLGVAADEMVLNPDEGEIISASPA